MSPREKHPSLDDWLAWLAAGGDPESDLGAHRASCSRCGETVDTLRDLQRVRGPRWTLPPRSVLRRALDRSGDPAPARRRRPRRAAWTPADVRGAAGVLGAPRTLTGSLPGVRIGVVATPHPGERLWEIRGKVWITSRRAVRVLLVHEDHVLAERVLQDSGEFLLREPAPPGWAIEVHPEGRAAPLVIPDPEREAS